MSSVQTYSARRHYLNSLTASLGGHTPAEWAKLLRNGMQPRTGRRPPTTTAPRAAAKPASNKTATHADRMRRLARAATALGPSPKPRALRPVGPEACSSWGSAFDLAPVCYAVDGATAAATGAGSRMRLRSTHKQRQQRLARAEADVRR
jgi:hypothetical protein